MKSGDDDDEECRKYIHTGPTLLLLSRKRHPTGHKKDKKDNAILGKQYCTLEREGKGLDLWGGDFLSVLMHFQRSLSAGHSPNTFQNQCFASTC